MEFQSFTLPNGIRIIFKSDQGPVGHCGILIHTGSRDEQPHEHGLAHFIEHVIFKGTKKRKAYHILSRLDDVGGELNAYTTKEETCIHASFLSEDFDRAIELIHDITFHSVFPQKELEKEKEVIVDEINSYKDSPSELIFDEFEELIFPNDPLGRNILGTPEHLQTFHRKHIEQFIRNNYHTNQMVFCAVGNISFKKLSAICQKYFGSVKANLRTTERPNAALYQPREKTIQKDTHQCHVVLGNVAYDYLHPNRLAMHLLNNLLGGPGMNSRLNMVLREKNGIAYNVDSSYSPMIGTGLFSIYFGTDPDNLKKSLQLIHKELLQLCNQPLGTLQLQKAIRQLKGQMIIASESRESQMLSIAKSFLLYNKVDTIAEVCQKIEQITAPQLQSIAQEVVHPEKLSVLIYQ